MNLAGINYRIVKSIGKVLPILFAVSSCFIFVFVLLSPFILFNFGDFLESPISKLVFLLLAFILFTLAIFGYWFLVRKTSFLKRFACWFYKVRYKTRKVKTKSKIIHKNKLRILNLMEKRLKQSLFKLSTLKNACSIQIVIIKEKISKHKRLVISVIKNCKKTLKISYICCKNKIKSLKKRKISFESSAKKSTNIAPCMTIKKEPVNIDYKKEFPQLPTKRTELSTVFNKVAKSISYTQNNFTISKVLAEIIETYEEADERRVDLYKEVSFWVENENSVILNEDKAGIKHYTFKC